MDTLSAERPPPRHRPPNRSAGRRSWRSTGDGFAFFALLGALGITTLAIGGAVPVVFVPVAVCLMLVGLLASFWSPNHQRVPFGPIVILSALGLFCELQALPLPLSWIRQLSPAAADVWARSVLPLGTPSPAWAALSLDPGASLVEAIKWTSYASAFHLAGISARRRGANEVLAALFALMVGVGLLSLGHAVLGARSVYGFYEPRHPIVPGHAGPFLNDNNLSGYLNLGTLIGLGLVFSKKPIVPRWTIGLGTLLTATVSLRTASRGGVAALALGIVIFGLGTALSRHSERVSKRIILIVSTGVFVVAAAFAVVGGDERFWADLLSENTTKLRLPLAAAPLVRDHLFFGVGRGAFESVFHAYRPQSQFNIVFTHPENFVVQWAAEWGVFVAAAAALSLLWTLWPTRLGVTKSKAALGAFAGVAALLAHNLVDLGLELPAVGMTLAAVLGTLASGYVRLQRKPQPISLWFVRGALGLGVLGGVVAIVQHPSTVQDDRESVQVLLEERRKQDAPERRKAVADAVRAMVERHPADYYFPLAGAMEARLDGDNPMPWIQRALERGPKVGRTHLLLGEVLASYRVDRQALMELRLATTYEPGLAYYAALVALRITRDPELLLLAVPDGEGGVRILDQMSRGLTDSSDRDAQARIDRELVTRAPRSVGPYQREAERLLTALEQKLPSCADPATCEASVVEAIDQVDQLSNDTTRGTRLQARYALYRGEVDAAVRTLEEGCSKPKERTECYQMLATTATKHKLPDATIEHAFEGLGAAACVEQNGCADAYAWMGQARTERGELLLAVTAFERAVRDDPTLTRWLQLADAAGRANLVATEVDALEHATRLEPSNADLDARLRRARSKSR